MRLHVNMSLLRLCAFAKCLSRRGFYEKCSLSVSYAEYCQLCVSKRIGAVRQISETSSHCQRQNFSFTIRNTEDGKKRGLIQSELLDVLEARIHQLQSTDLLSRVHPAKVQIVDAAFSRKGISSENCSKSIPKGKNAIPESIQMVMKGTQPSRWMKKLIEEKKKKIKVQQRLQQKIQKFQEKSTAPSQYKLGTHRLMGPGTSLKTITRETREGQMCLPNEIPAADSSKNTSTVTTASAGRATQQRKASQGKHKGASSTHNVNDAERIAKELLEVEELEDSVSQEAKRSMSSRNTQQEDSEGNACGDIHKSIRSYLEACWFAGQTKRAHQFLLHQHGNRGRRKYLNTDVYNIMIKVWAKKRSLDQIGSVFSLLEEAGLKPNLESYCAALECMGRSLNCSPTIVTRCLNQMEKDGLTVDDVFHQCTFQQDERDMVLKAVRIVQPDYQLSPNTSTVQSSPVLVQDFYAQQKDHRYPKLNFTQTELQERFKRQLGIERQCTVTIDSVEGAKPVTESMTKMRKLLADHRVHWQKVLLQAFRDSKMILANTSTKDYRPNLYPYLCLLKDREYVDIMIQSLSKLTPNGESLKMLARDLGIRVYTKYSVRQKYRNRTVEKLSTIYNAYTEVLAKDTEECQILPRQKWCELLSKQSSGLALSGGESHWPYVLTLELGTYLVDMMMKTLKINSDILNPAHGRKLIPILYHMYAFRSTRQIGFIKPHPILSQILQEATETKLTFDSYVMPMLCPPLPWTTVKFGAYLLAPTKLMRTVDGAVQHETLLEKCQNLHPVLDSLNQLGNCAWKVNKPMLDIIISIFNDQGSEKLDIPPPLSEAPKVPYFNPNDPNLTPAQKTEMKRQILKAKKKCSEMHSLRMDTLYKLSIANTMRDEIFWFPHNMDFRGRTYPCPPHFNHLGSDVTRATLLFAEGKPLGAKGLDWLKIHLVNLTGLKKRSSLQERLEYANTIMEDILDSADNPLTGKKWWMDADEPWQTLSCCMEIAKAVRSPDPTQFISHLPVHQDGSCNGLQHYAALGRDVIGAASVNLMPCELPQDVYSGVAQQVEEMRKQDVRNGVKIAQVLEGFINRKVVKQTVMTVVYGVTRYGGRLQIEKRLKEIDEFPKDHVWDASHYLARLVFDGLKEMFTGTREIQDWLTESARLISKSGHTVEWVTPLGLPVVQPYHRTRHQNLKSILQSINLTISHDTNERPDTVKQKNAFPPNFIHSLDSTHMMLTALHCHSAGLTFVSVHDCFWTHALTVDAMNKICREQFVALHSQPILHELSTFLLEKYCSNIPTDIRSKKYQEYRKLSLLLTKVPQAGNFNLQQVKNSTYFFS